MGVEPIFMSPPDRRAGNEKISEAKSKSDRNIIFLPKMTLPGIEPGAEKMGSKKLTAFLCKSQKGSNRLPCRSKNKNYLPEFTAFFKAAPALNLGILADRKSNV